ncbi:MULTISPECIES: hypothetical protein [Pseudomonas aeruginosa group]|uniref:hypothetical protein n=1 Tax=Pseudomonas aeruginosa group TaxID=136841 RepID=UPI00053EBCB2|nr:MULTISPECIES: hypothetical protein [Pseudomonas aeruginosa group]AVR70947.1 plasmid replication protein RepB [Pseudomonas paraeruginosa]KJC15017.1 hypothetical protein TN45_31045 [Pseudomonas aeruginosa]MCV0316293.1 plasmid replication protein RepB [Pseudomonas aeruginosa]NPW56907.1 plasmid replication protein RepB [Pseudomonas aeruginosa]NYU58552.1 plasmid replication protein RepB [Pseudomonas aeruginosa]
MPKDISEMRILFERGSVKEAVVVPAPESFGSGWVLGAVYFNGDLELVSHARNHEKLKIYKTLEAVHADMQRVGFPEARLKLAKEDHA